jgi:hypothetical protein
MFHDSAHWLIAPWANFYTIVGSSAGALTGLMFVVITLVAGERSQTTHDGLRTFTTPNVAHFCAALFVSAVLAAPWHTLTPAVVLLGVAGLYGVVYVSRVMYLATRLKSYRPGLDDWTWYVVVPLIAYVAIGVGAALLSAVPVKALFVVAAGALLLIFVGIHNAWDVVTWIAVKDTHEPSSSDTTDDQHIT